MQLNFPQIRVRAVSLLYASLALLISPAPARSGIEKVVGGGSVHQGETRRITVIGDGMDFVTSVASSDARIGVRLLNKKGLAQGRAKGQVVLEVAVPLDVPKDQDFNRQVKIAPNLYYFSVNRILAGSKALIQSTTIEEINPD